MSSLADRVERFEEPIKVINGDVSGVSRSQTPVAMRLQVSRGQKQPKKIRSPFA